MKTSRMRLMATSAATLALVVAGTSVATANHRDGDERGPGRGQAGANFHRDGGFGEAMRQHMRSEARQHFGGGQRGGHGESGAGLRGEIRAHFGGKIDSFVRRETTIDLGEDGIVTRLVDNGTVSSASDSGLDYTIATGESALVTVDEDTKVIAFSEPDESAQDQGRRHFRGPRLVPTEISAADIEAGSEVIVWAESQDDGSFLAQRIVVQPAIEEATDEADTAADEATDVDASAVSTQA